MAQRDGRSVFRLPRAPGGRLGRWLSVIGIAFAGTLALIGMWIVVLLTLNPDPGDRPGWSRGADLPAGRGEVASTATEERLIIAGGLRRLGQVSAAVYAYDPIADTWDELPRLPSPRHHAAAAAVDGGSIYISGGSGSIRNWSPRTEMWMLAPGAAQWEVVEPLPEGRLGHDMVTVDGRVYVVGGDGDGSEVLIYDPGGGWQTGADLGRRPDHVKAVVLDDEIWVLGGREGDRLTAAVEIYDPVADEWRPGPAMPAPTSAMAVGVLDGAIHVVGGEDPGFFGGKVFARHFVLPAGGDEWEQYGKPMLAVHGSGSGAIDDELIVVGGARRQGALSVLAWTGVTQRFAEDTNGD